MKGKGLTVLEETPELLRAKNATHILCEVGWLKLKLTYLTCTPLPQRLSHNAKVPPHHTNQAETGRFASC